MILPVGATSQSIDVQIVDDGGLPVTGLVYSTFPTVYYSLAGPNADVQITLTSLATITTAYTSGGVYERTGGRYRLDLPNTALASAGEVKLIGEASGQHLICDPILVLGNLPVNLIQLAGQTVSAAGAVTFAPGTVSTLGGTAQSGDAYARLGAPANATVSADIAALMTLAGNLNNLSALANLFGPTAMEVPASGSIVYPFALVVRDSEGHQADLTADPTIAVTNAAGDDRSANLSAITHSSTGIYTFTYAVESSAAEEGLQFVASGTAAADSTAREAYLIAAVVAVDTATSIAAIESRVTTALPSAAPGAAGGLPTVDGSNNVHGLQTRTVSDASLLSVYAGGAADADAAAILSAAQAAQTAATATETRVTLALPSAAPAAAGGLLTVGTAAGQIDPNGDGSVPATGSASPTPAPNETVGQLTTRDSGGNAIAGVTLKYWLTALPTGQTTDSFAANPKYATSNAAGVLEVQLVQGATYAFETLGATGGGASVSVVVPTDVESFDLPAILGSY